MTLHFNMASPEWLISKVFNNQSTEYSTNHMISPHYVACQNDAPKNNYLLQKIFDYIFSINLINFLKRTMNNSASQRYKLTNPYLLILKT